MKKSATLYMETVPKDRQLVVKVSSKFRCGPDSLPSMSAAEFYKYLGVDTGWTGTRGRAIKVLEHKLDQLRRASLKPQQRLNTESVCLPKSVPPICAGQDDTCVATGSGQAHKTKDQTMDGLVKRCSTTHVPRKRGRWGSRGGSTLIDNSTTA